MRAMTFHPEWCPAFHGVRFKDGTPSQLDKGHENRPFAPWSTIAPTPALGRPAKPGPWIAMHAGKHIGGRPNNEGALGAVIEVAQGAGWTATSVFVPGYRSGCIRLTRGNLVADLHPDRIVTSAIVAMFRVTGFVRPGVGGPWRFPEQYGWEVEVEPLATPVPCSGSQGLWTVPPDVESMVNAQRSA